MMTAKLKCGIARAFQAGDRATCELLVDELYNLLDEHWAVHSAAVAVAATRTRLVQPSRACPSQHAALP